MTRGLLDFLGNFKEIIGSFEFEGATKAHIIGLSACMAKSNLGLFSDPFDETAEKIAREITALTKKNAPYGMEKVVQWWLEISIITIVGILELAREKKPSKENENLDPDFRDELVLTLLFYTGYPRLAFEKMADALALEGAKKELYVRLFETIVLIFALVSYSKEEETIRQDLGEALMSNLRKNINYLQGSLEGDEIKAHLELAEMALERQEIDELATALQDMLSAAGYPHELFTKDISAMKELFKRLKTAYFASQENTMNMVHMIG